MSIIVCRQRGVNEETAWGNPAGGDGRSPFHLGFELSKLGVTRFPPLILTRIQFGIMLHIGMHTLCWNNFGNI